MHFNTQKQVQLLAAHNQMVAHMPLAGMLIWNGGTVFYQLHQQKIAQDAYQLLHGGM